MKSHTKQESKSKPEPETEPTFKDDSDICQQLMSRYSSSKAIHHRHLLATAAAIRSMLSPDNSQPLRPSAYFAAAIDNLRNHETLDSTAIAALLSFVSILAPLIPEKEIESDKASEAVKVLVAVVERKELGLGAASVSCVVKCLGFLIVAHCDLENWEFLKLGFETVLKFCIDKRPKVRRASQDCLEKILKSLRSSSAVIKESSKLVLSMLKNYKANARGLCELKFVDGSKDETLSKPGNLEVLYMLNLLKDVVPYLSVKTSSKLLSELLKLIRPHFSPLTRHIFRSTEAFFETSKEEVIGPQLENIINSLCLYVTGGEKNPVDTVISAGNLLRIALNKLHALGSRSPWMRNVPKVFCSVAGLLTCQTTAASQASDILKEMINQCIDERKLLTDDSHSFEDVSPESQEGDMLKSTCIVFENTLSSCNGAPDEHLLQVISALFLKLREVSFIFMKDIVLKLAYLMNSMIQEAKDKYEANHIVQLQNCIGSAVVAMGPERILTLIPISVHADNFTCSNFWLIPILKKHVAGASLGYFMEHIVPLAKSCMRASKKVKKSVIGEDLQAYAHGLWGLLPAFCNYPVDTHKKFGSLAQLLTTFLKEDSFMHQTIAVSLQTLVNQNKSAVISKNTASESHDNSVKDTLLESRTSYSKKTAAKNIKVLSSHAPELLQALVDLYVDSPPEKRAYIKDAVGCLASITDSSVTKNILMPLLKRFQLVNDTGEFEQPMNKEDELIETKQENFNANEKDEKRCLIMELMSSLIEGAKEDLISLIYNYVVHIFKGDVLNCYCEAYHTLSRILKKHAQFCSSQFEELIDLLIGLKPPTEISSLKNRFACFHILLNHTLEICLEEENTKAFLILNEIILALKDANDEFRKVAYDTLLMLSSSIRNLSLAGSGEPYHRLVNMIMGYLSGPSPHIISGAVSALSLLVYNDADISLKMPDLVPSLLSLLHTKAVEVIKAILGFVKVLVSSLEAKELQNFLPDITNGILLWSTVSRFHFRSKVTVILEIMMRKCGSTAVELVTPEKHKSFVKTVLENRHHKKTSKEDSADMEIKLADSSSSDKIRKRKQKDFGSVAGEKSSMRKRTRKNKENENPPTSAEPHITSGNGGATEETKRNGNLKYEKPAKGPSADNGKKRKFIKEPTGGGKKSVEQRNTSKEGETVSHRAPYTPKFRKHNKFGKK
ncbi:ribosomal RNA-processing protein 12 isoform X2 [Mercurialis annua]|uniref:ribosomal RNA-processing protein 12 isoform X2 n=1 Tax=Mercurialis annua TaxID=3986 RepID=UPI0021603808|nr:ribosomal RNA-processing protein 12 isoform X2 [Mercurialis annua]